MANNKSNTNTKVTKKSNTAVKEDIEQIKKENNTLQLEEENKELKQSLSIMQEQIAALMTQMSQTQIQAVPTQFKNFSGRKIKVISLLPNFLNLSTEERGQGRPFPFPNFGYERIIKFDDLESIVRAYYKSATEGHFYICDREVVEELGLSEAYEHIYSKEIVEKIINLPTQTEVELFIGMSKSVSNENTKTTDLQESIATNMAENINKGQKYDLNFLAEIQRRTGIDIQQKAEDLKILK